MGSSRVDPTRGVMGLVRSGCCVDQTVGGRGRSRETSSGER